MVNDEIDGGKAFDWGRTSSDYAKYRDIYPESFYEKIHALGLCTKGQKILDVGTGTGVIPRNMYRYGADFTGTDISENQIGQARILSLREGMKIDFLCSETEKLDFPADSFDVITACQCFFYFQHEICAPKFAEMLRKSGRLAVMYMAWLPFEDELAGASEELILKYNPSWTGHSGTRHNIFIPEVYDKYFSRVHDEVFDVKIQFTRESWNGRIKACRGIGASLSSNEISEFSREHMEMLERNASESFEILHYCAITVLEKK